MSEFSAGLIRKSAAFAAIGFGLMGSWSGAHAEHSKLKVFVSFGYYGNTWMDQNRNMMTALANSADYKDKVDFQVQVGASGDAQKQSQQINAMTEAGADIIILYPVSPTALNRAIHSACSRGITVVAWDATVNEPCATNVHADNKKMAEDEAEWVAKKLGGKGNVMMINGLTGVASNDDRVTAAKSLWASYPGVKVTGEIEGKWSDPIIREEISKYLAVRKWSDVDIGWAMLGCYPFYALQDEAGIPDDKKRPCAGSAENSERLALLPASTKVEGASGAYRPMGIAGYTFEVGPIMGAKAWKIAVDARLEGKKLPHDIFMPVPIVTTENVKLCSEGSWKEMNSTGCNTFPPTLMPNPETSAGIFDKDIPQLGLKAALKGIPED